MALQSFNDWEQSNTTSTPSVPITPKNTGLQSFSEWSGTSPTPQAPTSKTFVGKAWNYLRNESNPLIPTVDKTQNISQPKTGDFVKDYLPSTLKTVNEINIDPLSLKADPKKAIGDYWNGIKDSVIGAANNLTDVIEQSKKSSDSTAADRANSALKLLSSTGGALLSPITSLFSAANDIPVLGTASKLISLPFEVLGDSGHDIAYPIVNSLPISKEAKNKIVQGVGDIVALAGQIVVGGKIDSAMGGLIEKYGAKDAKTIVEKAQEMADNNKSPEQIAQQVKDKIINQQEPSIHHGTENGQLSVDENGNINFGTVKEDIVKFGGDTGEVISVPTEKLNIKDFPTKAEMFDAASKDKQKYINEGVDVLRSDNHAIAIKPEKIAEITGKDISKPFKEMTIGEVERGVSKVGKDIEARSVEEKLTKGFNGTAEYDTVTIKEQAKLATDLVNSDIEKAKRIISGDESIPSGLRERPLIDAMEEWAVKNDPSYLKELANSPLVSETSKHAQELSLGRGNPDSVLQKVKEIIKARTMKIEEKLQGKSVTKAKKDIVEKIKKEKPIKKTTKQSLQDFIKSIEC